MVSSDISFVLKGGTYKIDKSESNDFSREALEKKSSFGIVSPQLELSLGRNTGLEMGGVFRTNRLNDGQNFMKAKLWEHSGSYGNSIYANLKMSI